MDLETLYVEPEAWKPGKPAKKEERKRPGGRPEMRIMQPIQGKGAGNRTLGRLVFSQSSFSKEGTNKMPRFSGSKPWDRGAW